MCKTTVIWRPSAGDFDLPEEGCLGTASAQNKVAFHKAGRRGWAAQRALGSGGVALIESFRGLSRGGEFSRLFCVKRTPSRSTLIVVCLSAPMRSPSPLKKKQILTQKIEEGALKRQGLRGRAGDQTTHERKWWRTLRGPKSEAAQGEKERERNNRPIQPGRPKGQSEYPRGGRSKIY